MKDAQKNICIDIYEHLLAEFLDIIVPLSIFMNWCYLLKPGSFGKDHTSLFSFCVFAVAFGKAIRNLTKRIRIIYAHVAMRALIIIEGIIEGIYFSMASYKSTLDV